MSSSDPERAAARFAGGALSGFAVAAAVVLGAMVTVDPLGATRGNRLCPAGAKLVDSVTTRTLIAADSRPRTIVLGTSRVRVGFDRDALALLGPQPVANLGTSGGLPANFAAFAGDALAGGRLERAFIGVDFNMLHQDLGPAPEPPIADARLPALERARRAFLSYEAFTSLPAALVRCTPRVHPDGAPLVEPDRGAREPAPPAKRDRATMLAHFRTATWSEPHFAARLADLRRLVARLRREDVAVVLFSAPYQEGLRGLISDSGHGRDFERFHQDIRRLAEEQGVAFVDLHGAPAVAGLGLPPCRGGGIGCHYDDLAHYSPLVGERIARALAAAADQRPARQDPQAPRRPRAPTGPA